MTSACRTPLTQREVYFLAVEFFSHRNWTIEATGNEVIAVADRRSLPLASGKKQIVIVTQSLTKGSVVTARYPRSCGAEVDEFMDQLPALTPSAAVSDLG